MEFVKTVRGRPKLVFEGTLTTDAQSHNLCPKMDHNHAPSPVAVELTKCRNEIKSRAQSSSDAPQSIYNMNVGVLSTAAKVVLPSVEICKRLIRRNRTNDYPPEPASLAELEIEEPWSLTAGDNQEDFICFLITVQVLTHGLLHLHFEDDLRRLAASDKWFMD